MTGAPVTIEILVSGLVTFDYKHRQQMIMATDLPYELPSIYSFPPFFTRQPNSQTYTAQKTSWTTLILDYYRSKRLWRIDVNQETIEKVPIFSNKQIQRYLLGICRLTEGKIKLEFLRELVDGMVEEGQAEWVGGGKGIRVQAILYWLKPEEWANMISNWVIFAFCCKVEDSRLM